MTTTTTHTSTTHTSTPMTWTRALACWLAAARAPRAGAPVLDPGVIDGATGPEELMRLATARADAYLAAERVTAAAIGAHVWGASVPHVLEGGGVVWGAGWSTCTLRPGPMYSWVVEIACDGDPYGTPDRPCAALLRADAARQAGAVWAWIRPDVRPAARAMRELSVSV